MMSKTLFSVLLFGLTVNSYALVDYSEPVSRISPKASKAPAPRMKKAVKKTRGATKKSGPSRYGLEIKLGYENLKADIVESSPRVSLYHAALHLQTPYNIFFDASYFYGASDSPDISDTSTEEPGNPELKLGFNWLQFGDAHNASMVDLLVGTRIAGEDSPYATTGTNYFVGLETRKRFMNFALGLGYQYHMTGAPSDKQELDIGNIHHAYGEIGWQATYDIVFALEAGYYSIAEGSDEGRFNRLDTGISFSYFTPRLNLTLAPNVGVDLGATFAGKRADGMQDRANYKFWGYKGFYGDSLFANLIFSI